MHVLTVFARTMSIVTLSTHDLISADNTSTPWLLVFIRTMTHATHLQVRLQSPFSGPVEEFIKIAHVYGLTLEDPSACVGTQDRIVSLLVQAGFDQARVTVKLVPEPPDGRFVLMSPAQYAETMWGWCCSSFFPIQNVLSADCVSSFKSEYMQRSVKLVQQTMMAPDGTLAYEKVMLLVTAVK